MKDTTPLSLVEISVITGRGYPVVCAAMKGATRIKPTHVAPGSPRTLFAVEEVARVIARLGWYAALPRLHAFLAHRLPVIA